MMSGKAMPFRRSPSSRCGYAAGARRSLGALGIGCRKGRALPLIMAARRGRSFPHRKLRPDLHRALDHIDVLEDLQSQVAVEIRIVG